MPNPVRIALANLRFPVSRDESVELAAQAVADAAARNAAIIAFPECYVPGYRAPGKNIAAPDPDFLDRAWKHIATVAARHNIAVVLGTERIAPEGKLHATALVIDANGVALGFQDKVQIDPSEEGLFTPGANPTRQVFEIAGLRFAIVICHEGWRYPETVRHAVRQGAQLVFHLQFHEASPGSYRPTTFADPANTFHEKAVLCRSAENTCYFATINTASDGAPTTSAIANPDGTLLAWQPYGASGLLVAGIDPALATGLLASRCRY